MRSGCLIASHGRVPAVAEWKSTISSLALACVRIWLFPIVVLFDL